MKGSFVGVDIALSSQLQGQDENISASQFFTLENLESSDMDDPSLGLGQSFLPDSNGYQHQCTSAQQTKTCHGCGEEISDRYILKVLDCFWHESCLRCSACNSALSESNTCYMREGRIYCKQDHQQ
ncbi:LIM domain-containing protein [Ditylenchus destructor]|uniref:LIM domain-containing protein n=1 Tax=Ditylenchus destructor TaxID=166010 RepID=A0AAD4N6C6_9BILA|nr:LIM domain-containing protein [Ditylenchus destructor]